MNKKIYPIVIIVAIATIIVWELGDWRSALFVVLSAIVIFTVPRILVNLFKKISKK